MVQSTDGDAAKWKKPGGAFSGKKKKEYLKWKREQKRDEASGEDEPIVQVLDPLEGRALSDATKSFKSSGPPASKDSHTAGLQGRQDATSAGLQGRRNTTTVGRGHQPVAAALAVAAGGPARRAARGREKAPPNDESLQYAEFVDLPERDVAADARVRMARCRCAEVGFTEEGRRLGMPLRPRWRGVVRSAEELHRLEEASFKRWCEGLELQYGGSGRLSFYEPRLEFWRQLWRVLERSEVALVIVDARNPLLHFSDALARHILAEQHHQCILVLNKSDLVPAAALSAWADFFKQRYPGLRVVMSSAAPGGGERAAAESILDAIMESSVERDGRMVPVPAVLQASRDEVLAEAQRRNTHAKREKALTRTQMAAQRDEDERRVRALEEGGGDDEDGDVSGGGGDGSGGSSSSNKEDEEAAADEEKEEDERLAGRRLRGRGAQASFSGRGAGVSVNDGDSSDLDGGGGGGGDGWTVKGTKASKMDALRRKRAQRMHAGGTAGAATAAAAAGLAGTSQRHKQSGTCVMHPAPGRMTRGEQRRQLARQQPRSGQLGKDLSSGSQRDEARSQEGRGRASEAAVGRWARQGQRPGAEAVHRAGGRNSSAGGSTSEDAGTEDRDDSDVGGDSSSDVDMGDSDVDAESDAAGNQSRRDVGRDEAFERLAEDVFDDDDDGDDDGGGDGGAAGGGHRRARGAAAAAAPVVVCVVGEPNVGKSSTMNALLGTHRVAVSSHPGRTKHYQTHYMTDRLVLCDCPGLVFPRLDVALPIQILFGSYPIARCRDPYAVIKFLAEHIWPPLHVTLGLTRVGEDESQAKQTDGWSALALCEAYAHRHGWRSKRGGRLDTYRAANWLLRAALAGKSGVSLGFLPPQGDS